jgi:hypothetical protein
MEAMRIMARPINHQLVIEIPASMVNQALEVIVLPAAPSANPEGTGRRHKPSPLLARTVVMTDDLTSPAVPDADWNALG